ncbi:hypothetical protein JAAARDRAFT_201949 [Jaapia argillacea MUCL 33604]|uniref:BRCT domain-containing protein n=1 Tax=Jaapia argillacea MUCL 33604 TaxID=933084 RepID=A0A067QPS5_9AGAM|nr:hypothetical protein JAAARDRAFT_201949 [Jaapia argillacea MUCL 33604]
MDRWVTVTKPSTSRVQDQEKNRTKYRYNPYGVSKSNETQFEDWKEKEQTPKIPAPLSEGSKPSPATLTKHILNTLTDESNPITHSDIAQRTEHICSAATGHQRGEGRIDRKAYLDDRTKKLATQSTAVPSASTPLVNVRVYINGYLSNTTDIELKRVVALAGGRVLHTASGATHIVTSQQLSGSKTHKLLTSKSRIKAHVVRPEWIQDSIDAGKRLPEKNYEVLQDKTTNNLLHMFAK